MKKLLLGLALGILSLSASLEARGLFEGILDVDITPITGKILSVQYYVKGTKVRQDMTVGNRVTITLMDAASKSATVLFPEQKSFMIMPMPNPRKVTKSKGLRISRSGKTIELLGKTCEEWICESKTGPSTIYSAKGMGKFTAMSNGEDAWTGIQEEGLFPLRVVTKMNNSRIVIWEVKTITKKSLGESVFALPDDYQKMPGPN